jgi:hypothetical protein
MLSLLDASSLQITLQATSGAPLLYNPTLSESESKEMQK